MQVPKLVVPVPVPSETATPTVPVVESTNRLIVVPPYGGLVATTSLHAEAQIQLQNPGAELYLLGFTEAKSAFPVGFDLAQYGTVISQAMTVDGKVISQPVPVTVGGRAGQQYQIRGSVNNLPIVYWLVVVESEQHYHQILLWTLGSMEAQHAATVQRIVSETVVRSSL